MQMNSRICRMEPREADCERCGERIYRTAYNGNPLWEHATPDGERHGPFPRTHCKFERGHECPKTGCAHHARPDINKLFSAADIAFLHDLRIGLKILTPPDVAHLNWLRNHGGRDGKVS